MSLKPSHLQVVVQPPPLAHEALYRDLEKLMSTRPPRDDVAMLALAMRSHAGRLEMGDRVRLTLQCIAADALLALARLDALQDARRYRSATETPRIET
jgi:hypothetical protein